MKKQQFLNIVAPLIVAENERRGKPLFSSVVIAQAICESGWGTSQKMMKANAIFGIKAGSNWKGKVYSTKTRECYDGINYTTITDLFRAYNNLEESVKDYFNLILNLDRYKKAVNCKTQLECIKAIKNGGYATSPSYVETILNIIRDNKLEQYDGKTIEQKTNEEIANEIMYKENYGGWGTGELRKQLLTDAGYDYNAIQSIINSEYGKNVSKQINEIHVGDKVTVINNKQYNGKSFRNFYKIYEVMEIKGDRVVIGVNGIVTTAINIENIRRIR